MSWETYVADFRKRCWDHLLFRDIKTEERIQRNRSKLFLCLMMNESLFHSTWEVSRSYFPISIRNLVVHVRNCLGFSKYCFGSVHRSVRIWWGCSMIQVFRRFTFYSCPPRPQDVQTTLMIEHQQYSTAQLKARIRVWSEEVNYVEGRYSLVGDFNVPTEVGYWHSKYSLTLVIQRVNSENEAKVLLAFRPRPSPRVLIFLPTTQHLDTRNALAPRRLASNLSSRGFCGIVGDFYCVHRDW